MSDDRRAKKIMEIIGKNLYLKSHICTDRERNEHNIIGPGDIEIHRKDNFYYAIGKLFNFVFC